MKITIKIGFKYLARGSMLGALLCLLVGCFGQSLTSGPSSTLLPCRLPCWYGITPGKTTFAEAQEVLLALPELRSFSGADWAWGTSKAGWIVSHMPSTIPGRGTLRTNQDDKVVHMSLDLPTSYPLTLGQVTAQYGPPEFYSTHYATLQPGLTETDYWVVNLFYFQRGFFVNARAHPEHKGEVRPGLEVAGIAVFVPMTLAEYCAEWDVPLDIKSRLQPWAGFQDVIVP